ncbi:hypothetical protein [Pedobacter sp. Leaf216]|uniref:hypothetical protein n=1 Tax=Pedobacter sp. Leaf216 TaxID=1735684 RepID=UPI001F22DB53|nr:hypothetical protein [Pedobacter sp. Leaf216]
MTLNQLFAKVALAQGKKLSGGIHYANPSLNTVENLRRFLNNPTNGFKYNKAKFR